MSAQASPPAQRPIARGARRARHVVPVLAVLSGAALAYVLPAGAILRRLVAHREELALSTLRVDGSASFFGTAAKEAGAALGAPADRSELQMDSAVLMKLPGRCRLELAPLEGSKGAAVVARGRPRQEGNPIPAVNVALSQICPLLGVRSLAEGEGLAELERHLRAVGVEIGAGTSLARFGGEVAYVIGANTPGAPQLWVYKDNFLPARVRFADERGRRLGRALSGLLLAGHRRVVPPHRRGGARAGAWCSGSPRSRAMSGRSSKTSSSRRAQRERLPGILRRP